MATIHKLTKDGSTIFPATITDAIVHPNTGKTLTSMIKDYNVSELFPSEGLDGGNKYNLALAIQVLGNHLTTAEKTGGIKITFISSVSPYPEEEYYLNKNTWSTTLSDWGQRFEVGDVIANPSGSWTPGTAEQYIDQQTAILTTNLASEAAGRRQVDSNLQTQINTEVSTRTADDNTQNSRIGALEEAYRNLTESDVVVGPRPSTGQQTNVIYREPDQGHTPPQFYCDYMWYDNDWVLMAQYDNGIDNNPLPNSNNLVKSSGVFNNMGAFDISAYNSGTVYQSLTAALNAVPNNMRAGGMSVKFIQEITPAKYNVVKTEGLTTEPTGTELSSDPNIISGTYTASELNNLSTVSALPDTLNSSKTYYLEVAGDTTTYTEWVVTYVQTSDNNYVKFSYMGTAVTGDPNPFLDTDNWQSMNVDDEPTEESNNLVKSGGVKNSIANIYGAFVSTDEIGAYQSANFHGIIKKGCRVKNNGSGQIAIGTDSSLSNRINIYNGAISAVLEYDYTYIQNLATSQIVSIEIINPNVTYISDSAITTPKIANGAVNTDKIANNAVDFNKLQNTIQSPNLVNYANIYDNKYYDKTGTYPQTYKNSNSYCATDLIEVEEGETYYARNFSSDYLKSKLRYIVFFNASKSGLSVSSVVDSPITIPEGIKYVVLTYYRTSSGAKNYLYFGKQNIQSYLPYGKMIDGSYVLLGDSQVKTNNIENKSVTSEKLSDDVSIPAKPSQFGVLSSGEQTVTAGATINTPFIHGYKNVAYIVHINSIFTEVTFGGGKNGFYQLAFIVNSTNVSMIVGSESTVSWTESHGLTFGTNTLIIVSTTLNGTSSIKIYNDDGEYWSKDISFGMYVGGTPFLTNNGSSNITAELVFEMRDINQKIWLFGDSYFSYISNQRWTYYLINSGYTTFLMSALGGDRADDAIQSFQNLIYTGARPSFAVWCLGMNSGADNNGAVNANWLSYTQTFLSLCANKGITPILATIPSVPNGIHVQLNNWVKNSGYRYIDFAKAVEVNNDYYWKNWGTAKAMLSSDETHPTNYGAVALYQQVLRDFPEIVITV